MASFSISLFPPFALQSVFQHRGWSDLWISKQSQTLQWSVLLRVKTEVLITAYREISYLYDFIPFSFLPQVFHTSPTGLLASWTYQVAFYLKVFTWAILLAWNACSLDTHWDFHLLHLTFSVKHPLPPYLILQPIPHPQPLLFLYLWPNLLFSHVTFHLLPFLLLYLLYC